MLNSEDKLEIYELLARYTHFLDYGEIARMPEIWTEHCEFKADEPHVDIKGINELIAFFNETVKVVPHVRHNISNMYVQGNNHTATLHAYVRAFDAKQNAVIANGRYKDTVVKTDNGWRIQTREYFADN